MHTNGHFAQPRSTCQQARKERKGKAAAGSAPGFCLLSTPDRLPSLPFPPPAIPVRLLSCSFPAWSVLSFLTRRSNSCPIIGGGRRRGDHFCILPHLSAPDKTFPQSVKSINPFPSRSQSPDFHWKSTLFSVLRVKIAGRLPPLEEEDRIFTQDQPTHGSDPSSLCNREHSANGSG